MRATRLPAQYRRPAIVGVVAIVLIGVVAGSLAWPRGGPETAFGSPTPSGSGGSPSHLPETTGWSAIADLSAVGADGPVVALDASFRLASLGSMSASELASRLTVKPALDFDIAPDGDGGAVRLTPREPLVPGAVYRFTLGGPSGEELDSWAFQAKQSVRVVGTLPGNEETDVPLDTGIEITFDQDGVTDVASHVSIEPATKGRFEQHGRVTAFVPEALTPTTIYTVTVSAGVTIPATGESTVEDRIFRFETASADPEASSEQTIQLQSDIIESPTAAAPIVGLWSFSGDGAAPKKVHIDVFKFGGLDAAVDAFRNLRGAPTWSRWSVEGRVPTASLAKVLGIDAKLNAYRNAFWVTLPKAIPAGWYLVEVATGTRPAQAILQVTDVAGYLAVSTTKTLVWVNDIATGGPIPAATVTSTESDLGRTDKAGVLMADTPAGFVRNSNEPCPDVCVPVVTIHAEDGRAAFLPATGQQDKYEGFGSYDFYQGDARYWVILDTDRTLYRPTDTINIWGVLRDRDSGAVPETVKLQLDPPSSEIGAGRPAVTHLTVKPGPTGAFTASIPLAALPEGYYSVGLVVGNDEIRAVGVSVAPILKPAYRLDVQTGRRVYIAGDRIKITAHATFFEGTPVPGVPLRINGIVERDVTTDATGTAIYRTTASAQDYTDGPNYQTVEATPARPEEGEIATASNDIVVFPSSRMVDGHAEIAGGKVRLNGSVHLVDVDRLERELQGGAYVWDLDARGKPVVKTTVLVHFVEQIPTKTRVGTEYDFISKKAVPKYEYNTTERDAGTQRVKTNAKGEFAATVPARGKDHDYVVSLTVSDGDGHKATATAYASASVFAEYEVQSGGLRETDPKSVNASGYAVGEKIDLTMAKPATAASTSAGATRYLFFVAQRGLRSATVQTSSRFVTTFAAWAPPNLDVGGISFDRKGYSDAGRYRANFRVEDRRLSVGLSIAEARYAPGDDVVVDVTTRNAAGSPVASTVVLRAVDEKLFSIGGAAESDPLGQLYLGVGSGIVATYRSHIAPQSSPEGGDTGGGGGDDRQDFRDSLLFKPVDTGADGRGTVSFQLSDDLTSWHVSASAISVDLQAGEGAVLVPVGLPFFVDASIASEYLSADRPTIQVRTYGSALDADAPVTISVSSKSLGLSTAPIAAKAFATVGVPLPALSVGTHELTITATTGSGAAARTDKLTRRFVVVGSRLSRTETSYVELGANTQVKGGDGLTTVVLSDAGRGRHLSLLMDLAGSGGARLDSALAADLAASLLKDRYGSQDASELAGSFRAEPYQTPDGGLALLPYASSNLELSTLVAIVAPDRVAASRLADYLELIRSSQKETRERKNYALAGLAGLGSPVLPAIRAAAADSDLTIRERLMIGLGAAALGDSSTARTIATKLAAEFGESVNTTARLRAGESAADITAATALMAVLAADVGDPLAPAYWAYVTANPSSEDLQALDAIAYVAGTLDHLAVDKAKVAYTVDGVREVADLGPGESLELTLTAAQRSSIVLERLSGDIGVATSWREPVAASAFQPDPDVKIARTITPGKTIGSGDLVAVDLQVSFGAKAAAGCYQVIDNTPSGLVPVGLLSTWVDPETGEAPVITGTISPYDQTGQRVSFCAERDPKSPVQHLRYYARVVTPGTFLWEPAVAQSRTNADQASTTPALEVTIR